MSRLVCVVLATLASSTCAEGIALTDDPVPLEPHAGPTSRTRLLDVSAKVLEPGESQISLLWGSYSRGIVPGLQLSADFAAYLATLANLSADYQLVNREELDLSVGAGVYYLVLGQFAQSTVAVIPAELRLSTPLAERWELALASRYRFTIIETGDIKQRGGSLGLEVALVRYDRSGAWLLRGNVPIFSVAQLQVRQLRGLSVLDDVSSWGATLSRDQIFGKSGHVRFGLGYRHRPGIIAFESFGNLMVDFGLYWR
jgi:hypothetical protein